jgi:hypothetical protein
MDIISVKLDSSDCLVLSAVLRRLASEGFGGHRAQVLAQIRGFIDSFEPSLATDHYSRSHAEMVRLLVLADDPLSALDHLDLLLVKSGAIRTNPPRLNGLHPGPDI